jgi:hypothetical protein
VRIPSPERYQTGPTLDLQVPAFSRQIERRDLLHLSTSLEAG